MFIAPRHSRFCRPLHLYHHHPLLHPLTLTTMTIFRIICHGQRNRCPSFFVSGLGRNFGVAEATLDTPSLLVRQYLRSLLLRPMPLGRSCHRYGAYAMMVWPICLTCSTHESSERQLFPEAIDKTNWQNLCSWVQHVLSFLQTLLISMNLHVRFLFLHF